MKIARTALIFLVSALALAACGGGGSGSATSASVTGPSTSQFQALQQQVATLQGEVATLQGSTAPAVFIKDPNGPAVKVQVRHQLSDKATGSTSTCTGLGTLTGRPANSDPITTDLISGVSCTGFYFTVSSAATSAENAVVQPLPPSVAVFYDAPGCTGNAYVAAPGTFQWNGVDVAISNGALANGAVFTVGASYEMLNTGISPTSVSVQSLQVNGSCSAFSTVLSLYPLAPNDPTVSGVPSAPIPGPVTIG